MARSDRFAAQLLESGARGYAALASDRLLERRPDLARALEGAATAWRSHLVQRALELQTAVALGRPHLFLDRVRWSRRAYSAREIGETDLRDGLQCLREVLAEELPEIGRATALEFLDLAIDDFRRPVDLDPRVLDPESDHGRRALRYLLHVLEGRCREAIDQLVAVVRDDRVPLRTCVLEILIPAQREIGRLWHLGDSDIAEEHIVTGTTKRALAVLSHSVEAAPPNDRCVMTAAVQGDTHDIGGQALNVLLEDQGWRGVDLGADVPPEDLVAACVAFAPDVVVLSATLTIHLTALERAVRAVRANGGAEVKILVGGASVAGDPDLPIEWGADAVIDSLESAVRQVEAWFAD